MLHAGRGHIRIGRRYYQSLAVVVATASALPHLPLWDRLPTLAFWLLPTLVGGPILIGALRTAQRTKSADVSADVATGKAHR